MFSKLKKFFSKKLNISIVDSDDRFDEIAYELSFENIIGIDTEFDWRNTYYPKLALIQISTSKNIFLIDCLKLNNLNKFKSIFENKDICKIFHASRSDITVLFCSLGLKVFNIFDVQIAEKFISKSDHKSYSKIVLKYLNLRIDKSETNSNWLRRPLTVSQINYAANDVRYLINIFEKQKKILKKNDSFAFIQDLSKKEAILGSQELYIPRLKKLKFKEKIAKNLFMWREKIAMERNIPPSFVFKDRYLKKMLNIYKENNPKKDFYDILKNEKLADDLIKTLEKC